MRILNDLGYKISENSIREGLSTVIHKARFEEIHKEPLIIYDGGHNEQAINNLKQSIKMYYKDYKKIYVISILMRKDYNKMLKMLLEDDANSTFIFTSGNDEKRYTPKQILYNTAKKYKKEEQQIYAKTLEAGIREVMNIKEKNTVTFVIGSFYIYGDVDKLIKENWMIICNDGKKQTNQINLYTKKTKKLIMGNTIISFFRSVRKWNHIG